MTTMTDVALELRGEFDGRATELDRAGGFPTKNYKRMREAGYLRGLVPAELGGLGGDLGEGVSAQRALGWGCASTALAVNMHHFQVGAAADGYRGSGANETPLRRVADEGIVLGSTGAEAIVAGAWSSSTVAVLDGDEYVINGRKFFASQSTGIDVMRINAIDSETGEVLVIGLPMSLSGVSVIETWDTLGMRGTASHDVLFEDVRVPVSAVAARLPADAPAWDPRFGGAIKWFLMMMSGVYVGIADRARDEALAAVSGHNSSFRDAALTEALIGQLETVHFSAVAALELGTQRVTGAPDAVAAMVAAITAKDAATTAAVEVVDLAVQITGGKAYFKKSPLERLVRDVGAARHHPPSAPVSSQMIGRGILAAREAGAAIEEAEAVTAQ